ncbi:MAG TPA: hypothetical protein VIK89_00340 [Cytophagaceae bacterium]
MKFSQANIMSLSPENIPTNLEFLPVSNPASQDKASFLKTSANLSVLYHIPVRVIFNSNEGLKSLDGVISNNTTDSITINQITIPVASIADIQF